MTDEQIDALNPIELPTVYEKAAFRKGYRVAREQALEEAAQLCEAAGFNPAGACAFEIRALKSNP